MTEDLRQLCATVQRGYEPFYTRSLRLREPTGRWRTLAQRELRLDHASCGFYAALAILNHADFIQFWRAHALGEAGPEAGLTFDDVLVDIQGLALNVGLARYEIVPAQDGYSTLAVLRVVHQAPDSPGRMLVYTPVNGRGEPAPHWLACTSFHRGPVVRVFDPIRALRIDEDAARLALEELAWAEALDFAPPELPDPFQEHLEWADGLYDAMAIADRAIQPAPLPRDRPPTAALVVPIRDRGVQVCVGVHPYPFAPERDLVSSRRWYKIGAQPQTAVNALVIEGAPSCFTRAIPGSLSAPIYWEFHPEVLAVGMHIREWHKVYVLMGPVQARDDTLLTTGCFNPAVISALDCGVVVYDLIDPLTIALSSGHLLLFSLKIRLCSVLGASARLLPPVNALIRHRVKTVIRRSLPDYLFSLPDENCFPDRRAFIKAIFEHLQKTAPLELKASVEQQARSVLAALEAGTLSPSFDFLALMRALHQTRAFASNFAGGPGLTVQC